MTALGLVLVVAMIGVTLRLDGLATAANVAQLISVLLAIPALVVPVVVWWRRSFIADAALPEDRIARAKAMLAGQVAEAWKAEAALWALDDPDPMPVQWRLTGRSEIMDHPLNVGREGVITFSGSSDAPEWLAFQFRTLRRRRLVIIGAPGAGKTTLAVQLLRELISSRHDSEPVPVLMSVAQWDTTKFPRLYDWLGLQLSRYYPALLSPELGADVAQVLAARGHILPVLDGLDELPEAVRGVQHSRASIACYRSERCPFLYTPLLQSSAS